jgi:hypothetical protein
MTRRERYATDPEYADCERARQRTPEYRALKQRRDRRYRREYRAWYRADLTRKSRRYWEQQRENWEQDVLSANPEVRRWLLEVDLSRFQALADAAVAKFGPSS